MNRILYVTSKVFDWYDSPDPAVHFAHAPYSIDAIGYNLAKRGWAVEWMGRKTAVSPLKVARKIDAFKPDIVYTYGPTVALTPLLCRKFLCRHKAFKVVHGWDDHYGRIWNEMIGWPGKILMDWMEKRIVRNSDAVVTLSYALQKLGRTWGVEAKYIPNGADEIIGGDGRWSKEDSVRLTGTFNLVYTGDKAKWKRTADICRAMRALPKDVKLYMTGQEYDYLKPYYSENCISLGWLQKEEQLAVMSQADAFVCTSDQDCNAKLQEYLRWKKPILGFDGEANNFFKNGHNALLAKDGDYAPLVRRLIDEPELGPTLVQNAAAEIPVYAWAEIAEQFEEYFNSLQEERNDATGTGNTPHDRSVRNDGRGLHPYTSQRERALSDLGRLRVLEEALRAESRGDSDCGSRESLRVLTETARSAGLYVERSAWRGFGECVSKRTGESFVYFNARESAYYKIKSPTAKSAIKRTIWNDFLYEHVIHNILFPSDRYDLVGISEEAGELRIILRQAEVLSETFPTDAQVASYLADLGLMPEDRYFFGNEVLAVTDVGAHGDNVLVDDGGYLRFIDPLIRLKRPAREVIEWLVGDVSEEKI